MIYIRPQDWYLSIDDKKDFIEYPVSSLLDISGWDIKKVIRLFKRSNPPLYEWLNSPIVYLERGNFAQRLRDLMPKLPQTKVRHLVKVVERLGLTFQRSKRKPRSLRTSRRKTNNNLNSPHSNNWNWIINKNNKKGFTNYKERIFKSSQKVRPTATIVTAG